MQPEPPAPPEHPEYPEPLPPPGTWYQEHPDGFVVSASTRARWFVILYISFYLFIWLGFMSNITASLLPHAGTGARVILVVFWLILAGQFYGWLVILFGRYVLTVRGDRASLVLAVGPLRWRRRFSWAGVTAITWQRSPRKGAPASILLSGTRRIRFGSVIRTDRRQFFYHILQQRLARS